MDSIVCIDNRLTSKLQYKIEIVDIMRTIHCQLQSELNQVLQRKEKYIMRVELYLSTSPYGHGALAEQYAHGM